MPTFFVVTSAPSVTNGKARQAVSTDQTRSQAGTFSDDKVTGGPGDKVTGSFPVSQAIDIDVRRPLLVLSPCHPVTLSPCHLP
jgi:hypothetical protein